MILPQLTHENTFIDAATGGPISQAPPESYGLEAFGEDAAAELPAGAEEAEDAPEPAAPAADQDDAAAELPPMEEPEIEQDADDPRPAAPDTHVYDLTGRGNAEEIPDFRPGIDSIALSMGGADFREQDDLFMQTGVEDTAEGVQFDFGNGNTLLLGGVTAEGLDDHGLWEVFEDTDPVTGDRVDAIMLEDQVMEYLDDQWRLESERLGLGRSPTFALRPGCDRCTRWRTSTCLIRRGCPMC